MVKSVVETDVLGDRNAEWQIVLKSSCTLRHDGLDILRYELIL